MASTIALGLLGLALGPVRAQPVEAPPHADRYWVYDGKYNGTVTSEKYREGGWEDFNGRRAFYYVAEITADHDPAHPVPTRQYYYYVKNESGSYLLGTKWEISNDSSVTYTYDPPVLQYPEKLEVGKERQDTFSVRNETSHEGEKGIRTGQLVRSFRITGRETVRTPAGSFNCYVLKAKSILKLDEATGGWEGTRIDLKTETTVLYSPEHGVVKYEQSTYDIKYTEKDGSKKSLPDQPVSRIYKEISLGNDPAPWGLLASTVPKPKAPAHLSAKLSFSVPSGENVLEAREKGKISVAVTNAGPGPAYAVRIAPRLDKPVPGVSLPPEIFVGNIEPSQSAVRDVSVEANDNVGLGKAAVRIEVTEGNGFDADPTIIEFQTRPHRAPRLEISRLSIGGTGVINTGESARIVVVVSNAGDGMAKDVTASFDLGSRDIFAAADGTMKLGDIEMGGTRKAEYEFIVNKRYQGSKSLPLTLTVTEAEGRYGVDKKPLNLALGESAPSLEVVSVKAKSSAPAAPETDAPENVDSPPASSTPIDPEAYAVVVGIEKYRDVPGVEFAARDAQSIYAYLTRSMGFDKKNVVLLQNDRATKNDLVTYLEPWLKDRVTDKSRVFIFFAGHGSPDPKTGEGYIIPYDGNPTYMETAYSMKSLYANLGKLPTKDIIVAMDACFSGRGERSVLARGARPLVNAVSNEKAAGGNTVVLTATQSDQISTSYPDAMHGLLTYYLLKGLKGGADRDKSGRITTAELFDFVRPAVERGARLQHVDQTPGLYPATEALGDKAGRVWINLTR